MFRHARSTRGPGADKFRDEYQLDPTVPYTGGSGVGTTFMHCQESIYRFAQAMGETGSQLTDAVGVPGNGACRIPSPEHMPRNLLRNRRLGSLSSGTMKARNVLPKWK